MANHTIKISLASFGLVGPVILPDDWPEPKFVRPPLVFPFKKRLVVNPNRKVVAFGDKVTWKCAESPAFPFLVYFGYGTPMTEIAYFNGKARGQVVYDPDQFGDQVFKYTVAACLGGRIYIIDPQLIIKGREEE